MNTVVLLQKVLFVVILKQTMCSTVRFQVEEEQQEGVYIGTISRNYLGPYLLHDEDFISLHENTGNLYTTKQIIDRESVCPPQQHGDCTITHYAVVGPQNITEVIEIILNVADINDNAPYFPEHTMRLSVAEDVSVGTSFVLDGEAQDMDSGINGEISYHLQDDSEFFSVIEDGPSLVLVLQKELDHEIQDKHQMTVIATDHGQRPLSSSATVIVTVSDVNDNCPEFDPDSPHSVTINGNTPKGSFIAQMKATDRDAGRNAAIDYSFSRKNSEKAMALFHLDRHSGLITLADDVQADSPQEFVLKVLASGPLCSPTASKVTISVQPMTGPEPVIEIRFIAEHENQTILLQENVPPSALALLELRDGPSGCTLSIEEDVPFSLKPQTHSNYLLSTSKPLDFEMRSEYHVIVVIANTQGKHLTQRKVIKVLLVDVNDNAPQFSQTHYQVHVEENNKPGANILQVRAFDPDSQQNGMLFYRLSESTSPIFHVDRVTGELTVSVSLDREQRAFYSVTVLARDNGSPPLETAASVSVHVQDQNDNVPAFLTPHFIFFVLESVPRLAPVGKIGVTDMDQGANGHMEVRVFNGTGPFVMDNAQGMLRCTKQLDREERDHYELFLVAVDGGSPALSATAQVTIYVEDVNDNWPQVILPRSNLTCLTVLPSTPAGSMVTRIYAVDDDSGINSDITYHLVGSEPAQNCPFQIDPHSGNISLAQRLMGQDYGMHHLFIVVSDGGKPTPLQTPVWVNLLVNETLAQCHLNSVPKSLPSTLPRPTVPNRCETSEQYGQNPKLILLIGLGMVVLSLCLLSIAVGLFVKQKNMRHHVKARERIPLRDKHCSDHWEKD
ncbi:protocadherin-20 [Alosa pseudoharengus]|uniref:protocadherin-20 n=1 Tax=Alosa pseudoharengus TaxID=34774 RepID=UPI003F8A1E41